MRSFVFVLLVLSACEPSTPDPVVPVPTGALATPPAAPAASSTVASRTAPCAPWGNVGFVAVASTVAGRADFERKITYDDAKGIVSMHDSDPFANGKEEKTPRVIEKSKTLTPEEHRAVTVDLIQICPNDAAMKVQCAPGGCARLEVTSEGKKVVVEDHVTVGAVMKRLETFFPEVRKQ